MKLVRLLILLLMTSVLPVLLLPALGQQEIDPEHFDQAELAKAAKPIAKSQGTSSALAGKRHEKSLAKANNHRRTVAESRPPKAGQHLVVVRPTAD